MSLKDYTQTESYMKLIRQKTRGGRWRDQKNSRLDYLISSFLKFLQPEDQHNDLALIETLRETYGQLDDLIHRMDLLFKKIVY